MIVSIVRYLRGTGAGALVLLLAACSAKEKPSPKTPEDVSRSGDAYADSVRKAEAHPLPPSRSSRPESAAPPSALNPIVPGKSVGKVRIGEDFQEVVKTLGEPDSSDAGMGHVAASWGSRRAGGDSSAHRLDIHASLNNEASRHVVREIRVTSPRFTTPEGLSPASSLADILKSYKGMRAAATYDDGAGVVTIYDDAKRGIAFEVAGGENTPASHAVAIVVHEPGRRLAPEYLPSHNYLTGK